ncbi:MAG TPA: hypothetical protein DIW27_09810 [Cytophagales bacterium]|nr:hypothetical protein [Cytophagales bacterium]
METIKLTIPNMKSSHCQMTVTNVVKLVGGNIKSIGPAEVEIELINGSMKKEIINAIEKAGYVVVND